MKAKNQEIPDQDLINKIAQGDSKAFESLFNKYKDLVYGVSCKLMKDPAKAEDMTQTTWIKVLTESKNFTADYTSQNSVKAWIMKINRNLIIDQFRSEKLVCTCLCSLCCLFLCCMFVFVCVCTRVYVGAIGDCMFV